MLTAIVQLVRNRAPSDGPRAEEEPHALADGHHRADGPEPIVGGYAWSSLRAVSAKDDLKATMEAEFTRQFAALAARQKPAAADTHREWRCGCIRRRDPRPQWRGRVGRIARPFSALQDHSQPDEIGPVTCTDAWRSHPLCAAIPSAAHATNVAFRLACRRANLRGRSDAGAPTLGSLRIAAAPAEYPISADQRSVCLDIANFSVDDTLAVRVIVEYVFGGSTAASELTAATPGAHSL